MRGTALAICGVLTIGLSVICIDPAGILVGLLMVYMGIFS